MDRSRILPLLVLLSPLAACGGGPPAFSVEPRRTVPSKQDSSRSFSIGSLVTQPPGDYRFVRVHDDGSAEVRELLTFNGPGPWLAYVGRTFVPPSVAREALATIDAAPPASAPGDDRSPCVLAFDSVAGDPWRGCAYTPLAERVLAQVPRLTAPEVPAQCNRRACQVRLLREEPASAHERSGAVHQDIVLDENGTFWCASEDTQQSSQANTLRVERGAISQRDARPVFEWLTKGVERMTADEQVPPAPADVMVRGRGVNWVRLPRSDADAIRARWQLLAGRLPAECRSND